MRYIKLCLESDYHSFLSERLTKSQDISLLHNVFFSFCVTTYFVSIMNREKVIYGWAINVSVIHVLLTILSKCTCNLCSRISSLVL